MSIVKQGIAKFNGADIDRGDIPLARMDEVMEALLNSIYYGWNILNATALQLFNVSTEEQSPHGIFFKPDGTKMYVIGTDGVDVNEYDLSTPWNVTTAVALQLFDVSTEEATPQGIFFKPDGTKMYIVGDTGDEVNEYDLGTPWDVTTAVALQLFDVSTEEITPTGVFFKPDGTKMYIVGFAGVDVNEYDLIP